MNYQPDNPIQLIGKPDDYSDRDYILRDIAMTAVRFAMKECGGDSGLQRCDVCKAGPFDESCRDNEAKCIENGFPERESMNSAMDAIAIVLSGRT